MASLSKILSDLKRGKMIVLVDSKDRENEGDLIVAAEKITPQKIAFMAKYGRGLICVPLTQQRAAQLQLKPMEARFSKPLQHCNFTESVDARKGVTTGISAYDRAKTVQALVNKKTKPDELSRPGHIFPLIGSPNGVFVREGHTEGTLDLLRLAGMQEIGVLCEIMDDDGKMITGKKLQAFASRHKLRLIFLEDIIRFRSIHESTVTREVETRLPTEYGQFKAIVYRSSMNDKEHVALVKGSLSKDTPALVRIHSECLTGDVFHSRRCDCHWQGNQALKKIGASGSGVFLYLRQEGRGIGLVNKLKAYNLQDKGFDTVTANEKLGFKADARGFDCAAHIFKDLGVKEIRLITNNPQKMSDLEKHGITIVERIPVEMKPYDKQERRYLKTKKDKMGHLFSKL